MKNFFDCRFDGFSAAHKLDEKPNEGFFKMHAHDQLEVLYFISGYCHYLVEGSEYVLKPGDVMIMRSSETHSLKVMGDVQYERAVIHFFPNLYKQYDPEGLLMKPFFERPLGKLNRYTEDDFDSKLYRQCFESLSNTSPLGLELEIHSKLFTILCEIYKAYNSRKDRLNDVSENTDVANQLIEYVNKNLYEPLSLNSLSERFFLSQSQLNRLFRRATGTSIWEYITIKRLIAARNRIRIGEHAGKVCISCGFKDYSSFYRMYKARFGVSPKQDDMTKGGKK